MNPNTSSVYSDLHIESLPAGFFRFPGHRRAHHQKLQKLGTGVFSKACLAMEMPGPRRTLPEDRRGYWRSGGPQVSTGAASELSRVPARRVPGGPPLRADSHLLVYRIT